MYTHKKKILTSVNPVDCIPITGENQRCGLGSILPYHTPPSAVHVGTLYSSHNTCTLPAQVGEANFATGWMQSDGLQSSNPFLYENSCVCTCDGSHLQARLFVAAPVDVKCYPVQGHGSDGVTQEF